MLCSAALARRWCDNIGICDIDTAPAPAPLILVNVGNGNDERGGGDGEEDVGGGEDTASDINPDKEEDEEATMRSGSPRCLLTCSLAGSLASS